MDDVLMVYAKPEWWDHERFISDFRKSECYWKPFSLEDTEGGTFLETRFAISDQGRLWHWLKNDNEEELKVWRYQHYRSHASFAQKRALVVATLRKVGKMASSAQMLRRSAQDKMREFIAHKYPQNLLRSACNLIAATTNDRLWLTIREDIKHIETTRLSRAS